MKRIYLLVLSLQVLAIEAIAQVVASPTPVPMGINPQAPIQLGGGSSGQWLLDIVVKYPKLATLLFIMGGLRLTLKPLFSFTHQFLQGWGLVAWDQKAAQFESSKFVKAVYFMLDYLGSVKVPVEIDPNKSAPPKA